MNGLSDPRPNDQHDVLTARERADLGVQQELWLTAARWGSPAVLSRGEAQQRADDIAGLARMAREAVAARR